MQKPCHEILFMAFVPLSTTTGLSRAGFVIICYSLDYVLLINDINAQINLWLFVLLQPYF